MIETHRLLQQLAYGSQVEYGQALAVAGQSEFLALVDILESESDDKVIF